MSCRHLLFLFVKANKIIAINTQTRYNTFYEKVPDARVLDKLAAKYDRVRKEVGKVLGGQVLDYEAKRIFTEGKAEGKAEGLLDGERIGEIRTKQKTAKNLSLAGMDYKAIARFLDASSEEVKSWLNE